jgi:pyruvate dehydrogenase E2 component (dihydrolipoamide acetyltransferase)
LIAMSATHEITVPDIGDLENVSVIEVLVVPGQAVTEGQSVLTLETDKATMDVPASIGGIIGELKVAVGDTVSAGSVIATMQLDCAGTPGESVPEPAAKVPRSDAATVFKDGATATPTTVARSAAAPAVAERPQSTATAAELPPHASPAVRKLARELGVPLSDVSGTGDKGRITGDDVRAFVKEALSRPRSVPVAAAGGLPGLLPWPKIDFARFGPIERRELSRIRKISGANLHRNWVMIPHVTNHEDADITDLEAFRVQLNKEHEKSGPRITLLAFLLKACAAVLKQFPEFNASLDGEEIVLKSYYHLGFAADTPNGLVVPVIRDVDQKGVFQIAAEMSALAASAREGKLKPEEMSGGCFSVSSLGGIGGTYFTPIINAPEVAILGVGRGTTRMVWDGRAAQPRLILPLSLSWDHRVVDGAAAGRFNAALARVLADFRRVLL